VKEYIDSGEALAPPEPPTMAAAAKAAAEAPPSLEGGKAAPGAVAGAGVAKRQVTVTQLTEDCGHQLYIEQPEAFNAFVLRHARPRRAGRIF
jgi:pimeloyl-ACP methyl ester carboxylesterase